MRVKDRQKRANEAFTKPLTTHLTRDKGDFSCREITGSPIDLLALFTAQQVLFVYENSLLLKYEYCYILNIDLNASKTCHIYVAVDIFT